MLVMIQAWRNMPSQLHFEQLGDATDPEQLHRNAAYFAELDRVSQVAWDGMRFVPGREYVEVASRMGGYNQSGVLFTLLSPRRKQCYALPRLRDFASVEALAVAQIVHVTFPGANSPDDEYLITFHDAAFFDFLRVGMAWKFHFSGYLCPICLCVESRESIKVSGDFITHTEDARNLTGTAIGKEIYQCCVCGAQWERTRFRWHTDFTY
jgi:hypothetical protein